MLLIIVFTFFTVISLELPFQSTPNNLYLKHKLLVTYITPIISKFTRQIHERNYIFSK